MRGIRMPATINAAISPAAVGDWRELAQCSDQPIEALFPTDHQRADLFYAAAVKICVGCPVARECLSFADSFEPDNPQIATGVYGGMSPADRVARRRKQKRHRRGGT